MPLGYKMGKIELVVHDGLRDFLPAGKRTGRLECIFNEKVSIKHVFESAGIPHPEVGHILVNGAPVRFDYHVEDGDQIELFPTKAGSPGPGAAARFVLDNHLGKLAGYLRLLGFDVRYEPPWDDEILADVSAREERILLTRDRGLLKRKVVTTGYCVRSDLPEEQVAEVFRSFWYPRPGRSIQTLPALQRAAACGGKKCYH